MLRQAATYCLDLSGKWKDNGVTLKGRLPGLTAANRGGLVCRVEPESLAEYLQIQPGDRIISVNGHGFRDEIDYRFYASEEDIILDIAAWLTVLKRVMR